MTSINSKLTEVASSLGIKLSDRPERKITIDDRMKSKGFIIEPADTDVKDWEWLCGKVADGIFSELKSNKNREAFSILKGINPLKGVQSTSCDAATVYSLNIYTFPGVQIALDILESKNKTPSEILQSLQRHPLFERNEKNHPVLTNPVHQQGLVRYALFRYVKICEPELADACLKLLPSDEEIEREHSNQWAGVASKFGLQTSSLLT